MVDVLHFARKIYKVPNFEPRLETFGIQLTAPLKKHFPRGFEGQYALSSIGTCIQ